MIGIEIPGLGKLRLRYLVLDFNGTLAKDGSLIDGVIERLRALSKNLEVHIVTADTFGTAAKQFEGEDFNLAVLGPEDQTAKKAEIAGRLGFESVAAIGNGRNDTSMLEKCSLGIAVIEGEGAAMDAIDAADIAVRSINDALDLFANPKRLIATLRS